ncbi:hypothetical protein LINPERPRIM_LOCUS33338 [Linum perenne]
MDIRDLGAHLRIQRFNLVARAFQDALQREKKNSLGIGIFHIQFQNITDSKNITHLLAHIKLLLRCRAVAIAALDAAYTPRRFGTSRRSSTALDSAAFAYKSSARIAEAISNRNKSLALDPSSIQALETIALLLETTRCFPDTLHDLEHMKLLYDLILRDRKLPGPAWKRHHVSYREIPGKLCALSTKIPALK